MKMDAITKVVTDASVAPVRGLPRDRHSQTLLDRLAQEGAGQVPGLGNLGVGVEGDRDGLDGVKLPACAIRNQIHAIRPAVFARVPVAGFYPRSALTHSL